MSRVEHSPSLLTLGRASLQVRPPVASMRDTAPMRIHVSVPDVLVVDCPKLPSRPVLLRKESTEHYRLSLG